MGGVHWKSLRTFNTDHERTPTRLCLSLREWCSYNPFEHGEEESLDPELRWYQSKCTVILLRFLWPLCVASLAGLGAIGVSSCISDGDCSDKHSCESDYWLKWMAYYHTSLFIGTFVASLWAGSFMAARLRDTVVIILLIFPLVFLWAKSDVSSECRDYYTDHCEQIYNYSKICRIADVFFMILTVAIEIGAFVSNPEDDDCKNLDLSLWDHLYCREDEGWKRPLLVNSSIHDFKDNIVGWQTVVTNRNNTLRDAVKIANRTHKNSSDQASMLGKYSSLIEESSEKVTKASQLLDEQSTQIGELNKAVDEVITAMGSPADLDLTSFTGMTANDVKQWCYVSLLCCLILIALLLGIPKWLKLFDISLGIKI